MSKLTAMPIRSDNSINTAKVPEISIDGLAELLIDRANSIKVSEQSDLDSLGYTSLYPIESGGLSDQLKSLNQIVSDSHKSPPMLNFVALQEWEGYVTEIFEDSFSAILVDTTLEETEPGEQAEFDIEEISNHGQSLLKVGAVFVWTIGYNTVGSTKQRSSQIVFRNLPAFSEKELGEAKSEAEQLLHSINWT